MVHLIENYYAIPNNMGFTLAVDKGKTDKDGNKIYDTIGYCGSFEEAVSLLRRKVVDARAVKENAMTLYCMLKKYEDIGLTPEQIIELKKENERLKDISLL